MVAENDLNFQEYTSTFHRKVTPIYSYSFYNCIMQIRVSSRLIIAISNFGGGSNSPYNNECIDKCF